MDSVSQSACCWEDRVYLHRAALRSGPPQLPGLFGVPRLRFAAVFNLRPPQVEAAAWFACLYVYVLGGEKNNCVGYVTREINILDMDSDLFFLFHGNSGFFLTGQCGSHRQMTFMTHFFVFSFFIGALLDKGRL